MELQLLHQILQQSLVFQKLFCNDPEVTVIVEPSTAKSTTFSVKWDGPERMSRRPFSTTIMDAIAAAGGFKDFAKTKGVYILAREQPDGTQTRLNFTTKTYQGKNLDQNVKIEPGDTIIVP